MELLDIVDEKGEPTGETVSREKAHSEGIRHRTSHVWIFRLRNGAVEVLLQKRSPNKDSFPGCFDISSAGHIPAGQGYIESAVRELKEELGLSASPEQFIFCRADTIVSDLEFHGKPFHDNQVTRIYALPLDVEISDMTLQKEEVESVIWMPVDEAIRGVEENSFKNCIRLSEISCAADAAKKYFTGHHR